MSQIERGIEWRKVYEIGESKNKKHTFENDRGVRSDQHGAGSSATRGSCGALCVDSDVTGEDDGVPSVPGRRLDPIDSVENGGGGAIAGVFAIDALNIVVARLGEKVHEGCLDRFGLVDDGLGADFQTTDRFGVDVVFFEQSGYACVEERGVRNTCGWDICASLGMDSQDKAKELMSSRSSVQAM